MAPVEDSKPTAVVSPVITVNEAAKLLRCTRFTIDRLLHIGKFRYQKLGRHNLINRADFDKFIETNWVRHGERA